MGAALLLGQGLHGGQRVTLSQRQGQWTRGRHRSKMMSLSSTWELGPVTLGMWDTRVASSCSHRVPSLPISPLLLWSRTVQAGAHEGGWGSNGVGGLCDTDALWPQSPAAGTCTGSPGGAPQPWAVCALCIRVPLAFLQLAVLSGRPLSPPPRVIVTAVDRGALPKLTHMFVGSPALRNRVSSLSLHSLSCSTRKVTVNVCLLWCL